MEETRYDVRDGRNLESYAGLRYQAQCYGISLLYSEIENDRRLGVLVDFLGLGTGGRFVSGPRLATEF